MKLPLLVLTSAALLASANAYSSNFNYNYLDLGYGTTNYDLKYSGLNESIDSADGVAVKGSVAISPNFNLVGAYSKGSTTHTFDIGAPLAEIKGKLEAERFEIGVGAHRAVGPRTDMFGEVKYVETDYTTKSVTINGADAFFFSDDDQEGGGYGLDLGLRHKFNSRFEGLASVGYEDVDNRNQASATVGGLMNINQRVAVGVNLTKGEEDESASAGLRINF